tara:strand:+ start:9903 stop:10073 length:171 start_codon:yes stop_codon:yes gene_type:complete
MVEIIELATLAEEFGIWPVPGGSLDQDAWFCRAMPFIAGERTRWKQVITEREAKRK